MVGVCPSAVAERKSRAYPLDLGPEARSLPSRAVGLTPLDACFKAASTQTWPAEDSIRSRSASPRPAATARAIRSGAISTPSRAASSASCLPLLRLPRGLQEQPAEQQDRDDRALDHHDRAGRALVVGGRDAPLGLTARRTGDTGRRSTTTARWPARSGSAGWRRCSRSSSRCRTTRASATGRAAPSTSRSRRTRTGCAGARGRRRWRRRPGRGRAGARRRSSPSRARARRPGGRRSAATARARSSGASSGPVRPSTISSGARSAISRCSSMCAQNSSSLIDASGETQRRRHQEQAAVEAPHPPRGHGRSCARAAST